MHVLVTKIKLITHNDIVINMLNHILTVVVIIPRSDKEETMDICSTSPDMMNYQEPTEHSS